MDRDIVTVICSQSLSSNRRIIRQDVSSLQARLIFIADIVFDGTKDHLDILTVARTPEICKASGQSVCPSCKICYPNESSRGCFGPLKPETRVIFHKNERFWKFRRTNIWPKKVLIVEIRVRLRSYRAINGKESNDRVNVPSLGSRSNRHDRTWSITRDSHTSNKAYCRLRVSNCKKRPWFSASATSKTPNECHSGRIFCSLDAFIHICYHYKRNVLS